MAYLLEKRRYALLVRGRKGVRLCPSSFLLDKRAVEVVMAYILEKRRSALPSPKKKGRMTMATFLLSSVESCGGGHGLRHHLLKERSSALLVLSRRCLLLRRREG